MSENKEKKICGVVMPISAIDNCSESHWADVLDILSEAIEEAGFEANLVSNADDVGIIHKRIIQNLYDNPVVVCDVSGKNPNVMFELGIRLAFDKPTIIVKDDKTSYSFDTSAIEHLEYPRDLRFSRIVEFKQKLTDKIKATHDKANSDSGYTTFLKHFGEFTVAKLDKKEISGQEYILEELKNIRYTMRRLERGAREGNSDSTTIRRHPSADINVCFGGKSDEVIAEAAKLAASNPDVLEVIVDERKPGHKHLLVTLKPGVDRGSLELEDALRSLGRAVRRRSERVRVEG